MKVVFFLSAMLFTFHAAALTSAQLKEMHLIQGCSILDTKGSMLANLPGRICLFFPNGNFVSASDRAMRLFTSDNQLVWEIKGHFHHQVNFSNDRQRILALTSQTIIRNDKPTRIDKFIVVSLAGEILFEQTSDVLLQEVNEKFLELPLTPWVTEATGAREEISHMNSFYEIPKLSGQPRHPAIQTGNYIINGYVQGLFIMSPDLKKVLHHSLLPTSLWHHTHDLQVTKNGNILFFNNITSESKGAHTFSAIQEYDILKKKLVFDFTASPKAMFYSKACGGVQELDDDHILFSDNYNGTFIYSRSQKEMVASYRHTHFLNGAFTPNQQVKAEDLTLFLKSRSSPI